MKEISCKLYFEAIAKETRSTQELPKFSLEEKDDQANTVPAVAALFEILQSRQINQS